MNGKISNFMQIACVRRYTLTEGKESGLKVVEVNNGVLRFLLNESKALDIMQLWHGGVNISFVCKNGFTSREIPFPRRFEGGMLYTCGLDSAGSRAGYEQHGMLHNTPAKITRADCSEEGIVVEAEMTDSELFGKNLVLKRRITTEIGGESVTVEDVLTNRGYAPAQYCLLYHVNLGYPMLDSGIAIEADEKSVAPVTAWAGERIADRLTFGEAVANEEERCYFIAHNAPTVTVKNKKLGKAFTLNYSKETLPCFVQWSSAASGDYALGLEPATTYLADKFEYKTLSPNESVSFRITLLVKNI